MSSPERAQSDERALVLRAQLGDIDAFQELVIAYERRMLYYLRRFVDCEADQADVLQEIWLTAFKSICKLLAPEAFRVWLYKIAHDVAVSSRLRRGRNREIPLPVDLSTEVSAASDFDEMELLERAEAVHQLLERLSTTHREVLTLRFLEDMTLAEIAEVMGANLGVTKSRLHYAKMTMRRMLEKTCHV